MAMLTAIFSFLIIQTLLLVTCAEGEPQIEVHPSEIILGMSSSLDINCSFSSTDHPEMAAFASLILSRANSSGQTFQDVAAITEFSPDSVSVLTQEAISATGVYSQKGESFLLVKWDNPTAIQAGVYKCTARGLGALGQPMEVVNISTVGVGEANLNDIFQQLRQMEMDQTTVENEISIMENKNAEMENTLADLKNTVQALVYNNSLMSSYIADLQDTTASLKMLQSLFLLGSYENHDYYVSNNGYSEINNALDACKSFGGYLAEIDSENEYNAIIGDLQNTDGFGFIVIAGSDAAEDGTWVFQSNNKPIPFITWWDHSNDFTGITKSCLYLAEYYSWRMGDVPCDIGGPNIDCRYLCEMPRV